MKHQIWLEDWERELVVLCLRYVQARAEHTAADGRSNPIVPFSCRWTARQIKGLLEKISPSRNIAEIVELAKKEAAK